MITSWLFGSYATFDFDKDSDIDLGVVFDDYKDGENIRKKLSKHKQLDVTYISREDFLKQVRFNDYLLASILEDGEFISGDRKFFEENKNKIFSEKPDENSVRYNYIQALYGYDTASINYHNFRYFYRKEYKENNIDASKFKKAVLKDDVKIVVPPYNSNYRPKEETAKYLIDTVKNCEFSLGYLYASKMLKKLGRTVTVKDLGKEDLFNKVHSIVTNYKKNRELSVNLVESVIYSNWKELNAFSVF